MLVISISSVVFAVPFSPSGLKLSAPQNVLYNFDSTTLEIPLTVTGTPSAVYFLVFTKDNGATISRVRNGYLGWHYVNKIDTCLYLSPYNQFDRGANTIKWNGKDESGNAVPKGDYTYYLFGFDNADSRVQMTKHMNMFAHGAPTIITHDTSGKPLANPILYSNVPNYNASAEPTESLTKKWIIGWDPADEGLIETTSCMGWAALSGSGIAFLPTDYTYYFHDSMKETGNGITRKWKWVPNGESILQEGWGTNGRFTYNTNETPGSNHNGGV